MDAQPDAVEGTFFRPAKRRKFTRNRRASEDDQQETPRDETTSPDNNGDPVNATVSDVLRLQKSKARRNGIVFSNTNTRTSEPPPSTDLAVVDPDAERMRAISDRFVGHSGQVIDVDKHMFVVSISPLSTLLSDRD
jgi:hypothetical protein